MKNTRKNAKKTPKNITKKRYFLQNHKNQETEILPFCVITFELIEVQTLSAPQNDFLNFSFVKDYKIVSKNTTRNGRKVDFYQYQILGSTL